MLTRRWTPIIASTSSNTTSAEWKQWCIGSMMWEMNTIDNIVKSYKRISVVNEGNSLFIETLEDLGESVVPLEALVSNQLPFAHDRIGNWKIELLIVENSKPTTTDTSRQTQLNHNHHKHMNRSQHQNSRNQLHQPQNHLLAPRTKLSNHIPSQQYQSQQRPSRQKYQDLNTSVPLFQDD